MFIFPGFPQLLNITERSELETLMCRELSDVCSKKVPSAPGNRKDFAFRPMTEQEVCVPPFTFLVCSFCPNRSVRPR